MQSLGFTESLETHICAVKSVKTHLKSPGRSCLHTYNTTLCKYNTISGTNTCVYSHLDCIEDSLPEGDMAALFVHMVEVFVQREKVLYTALGCRLGGSCFCKVRGQMSSTKMNGKNI